MNPSSPSTDLRLFVGDLLRRPGSRRDIDENVHVADLGAGLVSVGEPDPVHCEFALESIAEGIVVHGVASVTWRAECARCLEEFSGQTAVPVDELFEDEPTEGETYPLLGDEIDLDQLLRDVLVTEFPLAPVPPSDEEGRCTVCGRRSEDFPFASEPPARDLRWSALDALELPDAPTQTSSTSPEH
jgi:uncharacterized protein